MRPCSRLNWTDFIAHCEGCSFTLIALETSSRRASSRRSCFWYRKGEVEVSASNWR